MSEFEQFFENEESSYGEGVMLNKYGDRYSIISARKSNKTEGTIYLEWCFPQDKDRKPKEKSIPLGVRLGKRDHAIKVLHEMLAALGDKQQPDEDIPF